MVAPKLLAKKNSLYMLNKHLAPLKSYESLIETEIYDYGNVIRLDSCSFIQFCIIGLNYSERIRQ